MATDRDAAAEKLAKDSLLQYFRREPTRMYQAGPISLWLRGGYDPERVEAYLLAWVDQGLLRLATYDELKSSGKRQGFFLTEAALMVLPPEDRSYGAL